MNSPVKTPTEARIAHVVGTLIGIGIAVAGFLANHKGVQIPCTGLTVGGAIAGVSHFRYFRVVETTVSSAVAWERENKNLVETLRANLPGVLNGLLPLGFNRRFLSAEQTASNALRLAQQQTPVDIDAIGKQVLAGLVAMAKAPTTTVDPAHPQSVESAAASPFLDPPINPQEGAQASV